MNSLQPLLAFSETAKRGGFAAAARALGSTPSTLAKAVARLETHLGVRLFHRTTRQVQLTPDGERLFARCQRVLDELEALQAEAQGAASEGVTGTLRIDMPLVFGRRVMVPMLARLLAQHPGLQLEARFSDGWSDLVKDGLDVAIRVGSLADSSLVAKRFASQQLVIVASPQYLAAQKPLRRLEDLWSLRWLVFRLPSSGRDRPVQCSSRDGVIEHVPPSGLRFNDGEAMAEAVACGLGVAQLPDYMVTDGLAAGRLVELFPRRRPPEMPIHAVVPAKRLLPARVKLLLSMLEGVPPLALPGR